MTPRLTSERLLLRPIVREDIKSSVNLFTDPEVMRFVNDGVMSWSATTEIFRKVFGIDDHDDHDVWAICTKDDSCYLGSAELKPRRGSEDFEIVYILGKPHWGKGYATEVAKLLVGYGFDQLKLSRVTATVDAENTAAIHVLEKLGFRLIGEGTDRDESALIYGIDNAPLPASETVSSEGAAG